MRLAAIVAWCVLVIAGAPAIAAPTAAADVRRLHTGLPPGFKRPVVYVYPVLDLRPLAEEKPATAPGPDVFQAFVEELASYGNLEVVPPSRTVKRIKARPEWLVREQVARKRAAEGEEAYGQVRLDLADRHLKEATDAFTDLEYQYIDPQLVARAERTRGFALLESGRPVDAGDAFKRALQVDARLRLRKNFDRDDSVEAYEAARRTLAETLPLPPELRAWPVGEPKAPNTFVLRARLLPAVKREPARLEVAFLTGGTLSEDSEPLTTPDAASRLAARVWACLPFGQTERDKKSESEIRLDAGFSWFLFTANNLGTEPFGNVGAHTSFFWSLARHIGMQLAFQVANSGRDEEEDLRKDILTFRGFAGPGYELRVGPWRFDAHLGVEVASPGRIVFTDNVYCKYGGATQVDRRCGPEDISETPRTFQVGLGLTGGASLDLVDDIYLSLEVNVAEYIYELDETDLGRPAGGAVSLGYRFR